MYAVIKTGGKQYKVFENQVIKIEKIEGKAGEIVKFNDVLALGAESGIELNPTSGVVTGELLESRKDKKVIIFKKKRRHNYRRKNGHRQEISVVRIFDVSGKGSEKRPVVAKKESKVLEAKEASGKSQVTNVDSKVDKAKVVKKTSSVDSKDNKKVSTDKTAASSKQSENKAKVVKKTSSVDSKDSKKVSTDETASKQSENKAEAVSKAPGIEAEDKKSGV